MQEFLNPKSMLTPGIAGATMMFLVNGLSVPFPELPARYIALGLSFVIGAVVFNADNLKRVERGIFWVLNSLVIFVVGFGTANLGNEVATSSAASRPGLTAPTGGEHTFAWLIPSGYAADEPPASSAAKKAGSATAAKAAVSPPDAEKLQLELEALRRENEQLMRASPSSAKPPPQQPSFFRKW